MDWLILSFIAGCVNAGGFLGAHRFVSHVTGFATLFGAEAARGKWDQAIGILSVPAFFLLGVIVSAYLVDNRVHRGKRPHYATVMALVCSCMLVAAIGGRFHWFGEFGSEPKLSADYFFLALLCAASGLQNAAISSASGATVRTTHLTGLTTDLGIGFVRALTDRDQYRAEMRATQHRLGMIATFAGGSAVASYAFLKVAFLGFLLPAGLAAYLFFEALAPYRRLRRLRRAQSTQSAVKSL
ncbi:MAG: YoaK family protein [Bacteriovoracia bacterium]